MPVAIPLIIDQGLTLFHGDVVDVLRALPDASVNCVVTSPPFWKMRDYKVKGQLGQEATPELFAESLTDALHELHRVLREDGSFWINMGDKYLRKRLVGVPSKVRDALAADDWFFRAEVIWNKLNVRPESAKDRVTHSHEYLYHFTRGPKYFYDAAAIAEPAKWERWGDQTVDKYAGTNTATGWMKPKSKAELSSRTTRNKRSVWSFPTSNYPGAHDAVFPEDLVEPCILATCPQDGVVLDPFIGSGTTAVVATRLGRRCIGIDLDKRAVRQAAERVARANARRA